MMDVRSLDLDIHTRLFGIDILQKCVDYKGYRLFFYFNDAKLFSDTGTKILCLVKNLKTHRCRLYSRPSVSYTNNRSMPTGFGIADRDQKEFQEYLFRLIDKGEFE